MNNTKININLRDGREYLGKTECSDPCTIPGCYGFKNEDETLTYIPIDLIKEINFYLE